MQLRYSPAIERPETVERGDPPNSGSRSSKNGDEVVVRSSGRAKVHTNGTIVQCAHTAQQPDQNGIVVAAVVRDP